MKRPVVKLVWLMLTVVVILSVTLLAACAQSAPASGPTTAQPAGQVFKWKLHYYAPPQEVYDRFCVEFAKNIKATSNGRLDFTTYPEAALVPANQMLDAVKNGTVEMAVLGPYFSGVMPVLNLEYGFPGTYRNYEDFLIHHTRFGFKDILTKAYGDYGVQFLGPDSPDGGYMLSSKVPITKVDDFKGFKVRATAAVGETLKSLGAAVTTVPGTELYTAVATGVVSGAIYGGAQTAIDQMKLGEVVKYMVMPYFLGAHGPNTYVVNPAAWKTLPPDLKAIIQGEVISVAGDWYPRVRYKDLQTITDYQKKGLQISQIPDAEFAKIAAAGRQVLSTMVADKKDANFTAGAKSLEDFMKWRGYWQ